MTAVIPTPNTEAPVLDRALPGLAAGFCVPSSLPSVLPGIAGLLDQLVGGGLEPRQRLVHFLLVGGALQHLLRVGERGGESIPTRLVISLVIALHLIDKRLQLGLVQRGAGSPALMVNVAEAVPEYLPAPVTVTVAVPGSMLFV